MNPRDLVDHIRSGPAKLVLDEALHFRRRTRSNPCDFNEFLQALQSSETIRNVDCGDHTQLSITEHEWVLLVKTLGSIKGIDEITLRCIDGSHDFHPVQVIADAVNNAHSLRGLFVVLGGETFPRDPAGQTALANALREHTGLQYFAWFDRCPLLEAAPWDLSLDPLLRALPACPHLQNVFIKTKYASADAMKNLIQLRPTTELLHLVLEMDQYLAVAVEIRRGRCNVQFLTLGMLQGASSEATEVVKEVASAIREDRNLKHLYLHMENDFTDEAGMALAEALTVNTTLRNITLCSKVRTINEVPNEAKLGAPAYEAFSAMLRVNTSLRLELPPFDDAGGDERIVDSRNQIRIEQGLNYGGRGRLLSSSQTPRDEWVDALNELNFSNVDEPPAFNVSCLYSLLLLHPSVCLL